MSKFYVHYYCWGCKEATDCTAEDTVVKCNKCGTIVQYTKNIPKNQLVRIK